MQIIFCGPVGSFSYSENRILLKQALGVASAAHFIIFTFNGVDFCLLFVYVCF